MKTLHTILALSVALTGLGLFGCDGGSVPIGHEDHTFEDGVDVDLGTQPWRERRRMDIDQLDQSIRDVTGGIGWERWRTNSAGEREVAENYFVTYDDTLGVPDYINSATEDLSVSLLFEKFLDDAARDVCRRLVDREGGSGRDYDGDPAGIFGDVDVNAEDSSATDISETLASLLLRFHGRQLATSNPDLDPEVAAEREAQLSVWRDLFARLAEAAAAAESPLPRRAWEGVCIALITHPDFYTY